METLFKVAAVAKCCPYCHGQSGVTTTMTETHVMNAAWGEQLESGNCGLNIKYGNAECLDCGRRFQLNALIRHKLVVKPVGACTL